MDQEIPNIQIDYKNNRMFLPNGTWHKLNNILIPNSHLAKLTLDRRIPIIDMWKSPGVYWIIDTGCNSTATGMRWHDHSRIKIRAIGGPYGLPAPDPFVCNDKHRNFGGIGGSNAATCKNQVRYLISMLSTTGERLPGNTVEINLTSSDHPPLLGSDTTPQARLTSNLPHISNC